MQIDDDFRPLNTQEALLFAILVELRAMNERAGSNGFFPPPTALGRDAPPAPRALPVPKKTMTGKK